MAEATDIVCDLAKTASRDALSLIINRARLIDGGHEQIAMITAAIATLAGTVHGAIIDQETDAVAGLDALCKVIFDTTRRQPIMATVITIRAPEQMA